MHYIVYNIYIKKIFKLLGKKNYSENVNNFVQSKIIVD